MFGFTPVEYPVYLKTIACRLLQTRSNLSVATQALRKIGKVSVCFCVRECEGVIPPLQSLWCVFVFVFKDTIGFLLGMMHIFKIFVYPQLKLPK